MSYIGYFDAIPTDLIYDDRGYFWVATYDASSGISELLGGYYLDKDNNLAFHFNVTLPSGPHSMVFDGVHIWVASAGADIITKVRAEDGVVLAEYDMEKLDGETTEISYNPVAITYDGVNIWVANSDTPSITIIDTYDGSMLFYSLHGGIPSALAFDGVNIWVTLSNENEVRKL
jgi:hypothetical protein